MPTHDDLWISRNQIRPLWWDRANGYIIDTEQQSLSIAVIPLAYTRELPAAERMERMGYPHKSRACGRITCTSDGATSDWRTARTAVPFEDGIGERRRAVTAQELGALLSGIDLQHAVRRKRYRRV